MGSTKVNITVSDSADLVERNKAQTESNRTSAAQRNDSAQVTRTSKEQKAKREAKAPPPSVQQQRIGGNALAPYRREDPVGQRGGLVKTGVFGNFTVTTQIAGGVRSYVLKYYPYVNGYVSVAPALTETLASYDNLQNATTETSAYDSQAQEALMTKFPGGIVPVGGGFLQTYFFMLSSESGQFPVHQTVSSLRRTVYNSLNYGSALLPIGGEAFLWLVYGFASQETIGYETERRFTYSASAVSGWPQLESQSGTKTYHIVTASYTVEKDQRTQSLEKGEFKKAYLITPGTIKAVSFPGAVWTRLRHSIYEPLPTPVTWGTGTTTVVTGIGDNPGVNFTSAQGPSYTNFRAIGGSQGIFPTFSIENSPSTYGYGYVGSNASVWTPGVFWLLANEAVGTSATLNQGIADIQQPVTSTFKWGLVRPFPVPIGTTPQPRKASEPYSYGAYGYVWDWNKPSYCRQRLLGFGFSAADLTP